MKECPHCETTKPISEFASNKARCDGLNYYCKPCHNEKRRKSYLNTRAETIKRHTAYNNEYQKRRCKTDVNYKLRRTLRSRLASALNGKTKGGSAITDLGCTIEELKAHLERQFQPGMTWDNHGPAGWHIDHILPLSAFDLTNPAEMVFACHYSNLQPLWASDNIRKNAKY